MMSRRCLLLCTSSPSSKLKPVIASYFCTPIKEYSKQHKGGGEEEKEELVTEMERAQSTAELMKKLNEDKLERLRNQEAKYDQGFVSHTSDKLVDSAKEAVGGDTGGDPEAVKAKHKEDGGSSESYHKPRHGDGIGPTSV